MISDDTRTIHMFWRGGSLPPLAQACIQSFVSHGHPVRVHSYDPLVLPAGAVLEDARDVIPTADPLHYVLADRVEAFADCFRYALLHQRGGWWVDTDVYCLTNHLPSEGWAWAEQEPHYLANAILRFPKGDPLCERLAALARRRAAPSIPYNALGPDLLTEVLSSHHEGPHFGSRETFYPLHWREAYFLWLPKYRPEVLRRTKDAAFLHCWASGLCRMGIQLKRSAPTGSFLADILRDAPEALPLRPWHRFETQRRIGRFIRQHVANDYWGTLGGQWNGLAQTLGFCIPTPREALAATRRIVARHVVSLPRLQHTVIQLRAAVRMTRLPPGSLRLVQQEINADRRFLIKRGEELGPIFKVNLDGYYTTCVLDHERAMRLLAANEDRLPGWNIDLRPLFPIGVLRVMTGETHQQYRRLFIQAMQATPLSVHQDDSERIIRDGIAALAQASTPLAGDALRNQLRQMTTRIMFRVLFGLREGSPGFSELEASYRRFGPSAPAYEIHYEHACAFAEITTTLRQIAQDLRRDANGGYPACFLRHLTECGALDDETVLGNLAYLLESSHFDLYSLWHWVLTFLATKPEISSTFASKLDAAARRQYAEAIVLETLRMEQIEFLYRCVTRDIVFEGFLIPGGTRLRVCLWEGHKDPMAFTDPFTFDPSRFVGQKHGYQIFAPFGLGQHHCVGANLVVGLSTLFVQKLLEGYTLVASEVGPAHRGAFHWQPSPACAIRLTSRASPEPG